MRIGRRRLVGTAAAAALMPSAAFAQRAPRIPKRMRVWEVGEPTADRYGLHIVEQPVPTPGPGEVLLKVMATGLNARDLSLMKRVHIFGQPGDSVHRVPLDDNASVVVALGPGVTRVKVGDRVVATHFPHWVDGPWDDESMSNLDFSVNTDGFLREYAAVSADALVKVPDVISDVEAATMSNAGLTAWCAVTVDAKVAPAETLVTLGSGGVSVYGVQFAKYAGATVIVTSSSDDKLARLKSLGADMGINYRAKPDWEKEVMRLTGGRGADVVLNTVGIGEMERCINACANNGRIILIGANPVARGGSVQDAAGLKDFPRAMIMRKLTIKATVVGSRRMLEDMVHAVAANRIQPVIDKVFAFDQTMEAIRYMEAGAKIGKIMIKVA